MALCRCWRSEAPVPNPARWATRSTPAATPAEVRTSPSSTNSTSGSTRTEVNSRCSRSASRQWVVAGRWSSSPAAASTYAPVQIAKARGAYVVGTAREVKHEFVRGLAADEVVDYTRQDFAVTVKDLDVVLDTIGGEYGARSLRTLRPGGTLVSVLPLDPDFPAEQAGQARIRAVFMLVGPDLAGLCAIASLAENGQLRVVVDTVVPLAEAAEAHARGETGRTAGKIVLSVTP
ncbi:hypothetical protein P3T39_002544 [Kitasatospora sp. GP82]|nr:hypothetical protein [Kitasatospora sp. GP82]